MNNTAIVLASGMGKRMGGDIPKQFALVGGKPLIYYALKAFEESDIIQNVVIATSDIAICNSIVSEYNFTKVSKIVQGGKERYHSVYNALMAIEDADYVFIHDGARPNVDEFIIRSCYDAVTQYDACVAAVKSKDTIKIADQNGFVETTPDRNSVYIIQTPQTFKFDLIKNAYQQLIDQEEDLLSKGVNITDDAMVCELFTDKKVYLCDGEYTNIKVTTPDDLKLVITD